MIQVQSLLSVFFCPHSPFLEGKRDCLQPSLSKKQKGFAFRNNLVMHTLHIHVSISKLKGKQGATEKLEAKQ